MKIERKQIEDNIKVVGNYSDEVNELTIKTFVFTERVNAIFENGSPKKKRKVIMAIRMNLYLKNKNVWIQPQFPFLLIESAV